MEQLLHEISNKFRIYSANGRTGQMKQLCGMNLVTGILDGHLSVQIQKKNKIR